MHEVPLEPMHLNIKSYQTLIFGVGDGAHDGMETAGMPPHYDKLHG